MASTVLLSPSEVDLSKALGSEAVTSPLCEQKGADILIYTDSGLVGLQRKQVPNDFLDSFGDGRFARLLPLLTKHCAFYRVVCEGQFKYWPDGTVHLGMFKGGKRIPSRYTRRHVHGMINDLEFVWGIQIHWTDGIEDTVNYIHSVQQFMDAKKHTGLFTRPKAKGLWYVPTARDIELWILQSFPGVGVKTADAIIKHFGCVPLKWSCSAHELAQVERVGVKKATELMSYLNKDIQRQAHDGGIEVNSHTPAFNKDLFSELRRRIGR